MIQGFSGGLLNRELIYQTDLPSFQRDFASLKTLDHGTGPAITFTRASDATYFDADGVLQTASNNVARFDHDPATGGSSLGLLIEEARTNSFQRSAEFDNAYWTKTGVTISANAATAPDGTVSADEVVEDNANSSHTVSRVFTSVSGTTYTLSIFVKQSVGTRNIRVAFNPNGFDAGSRAAFFNPSNGTIVSADAGVTATVQTVGSFYRFSTTATATSDSASAVGAFALADGTTLVYQGDGASSIFYWGAQLEAGAFPTSYIPTTAAAATRSADSAVVTPISSFYNASEGTLFAEWQSLTASILTGTRRVVIFTINTNSEFGFAQNSANNSSQAFAIGPDISNWSRNGAQPILTPIKTIVGAANNDAVFYENGNATSAISSPQLPQGLTTLAIGSRVGTSIGQYHGYIRKIAYWPKRLTNTLLEQLTT